MVFFVFILCGFAGAIATRTLDPLTIVVAQDLAVPVSSVALLASVLALPYALAQPILGPIGDHFGKARMLKISLWALAASLAAGAMAHDYAMLALSRALTGIAGAGVMPVAMAMIGDRYRRGRQVAIARFIAAAIVGQILGAVFAGIVEAQIGWRGVIWVCFGFVALAAAAASALLPGDARSEPLGRFSLRVALQTYGRIFRNRRAWPCYITAFVTGGLTFGFLPYVAPVLQAQGNGGAREAGFVIAGMAAGSLLFSLFIPLMLRIASRPTLIAFGGLVCGGAFAAYAIGLPWPVQAVIFAFVGFGFFMMHNSVQTEVAEIAPEARSSAYALHAGAFFLGQAAGPMVWSLAIAQAGPSAAMMWIGAALTLMGLAASFMFSRLPRIMSGAL